MLVRGPFGFGATHYLFMIFDPVHRRAGSTITAWSLGESVPHSDRPGSADEVAARVRLLYPGAVALLRQAIHSTVTSEGRSDIRLRPDQRLYGPSIADNDTRVLVSHSFHPYANDLGTFPPGSAPMFVRVAVSAYRMSESEPPLQWQSGPTAGISVTEAEGWLRGGLGDQWADFAYLRSESQDVPERAGRYRFGFVMDVTGSPMLVPNNFDWSRVDGQLEENVRKIEPSPANIALRQQILREGPFADPTAYLDPRTTADGRWRIEASVREADRDAVEAIGLLADLLSIRGYVHSALVPLSLHLSGRTATLTYRLGDRPEVYDAAVPVPSRADMSAPAVSTDWIERFGYHPPTFPMTTEQWARGLCAFWTEMVAYGRIGDARPPWSDRRMRSRG